MSYENDQGMKSILKFSNFSKMGKWVIGEMGNFENSKFLKNRKCHFGVVGEMGNWGNGKMSFLKSSTILEYFSYLYRFHTTYKARFIWT